MIGGGFGMLIEMLVYFIFNVGFEWYDMGYVLVLVWILMVIMMVILVWYVWMLFSERKMVME